MNIPAVNGIKQLMRQTWIIVTVVAVVLVTAALVFAPRLFKPYVPPSGDWPRPIEDVPVVSTRGHLKDGELTAGHTPYDYTIEGVIDGLGADDYQPYDLLVVVHGFNNTEEKARYKFDIARESLHRNAYNGVLAGFSWDADTQSDPVAATGYHLADEHAALNGTKLAQFLVDYRSKCSVTRLHLVGYSMGARVVLECLYALENDRSLQADRFKLSSVHLIGAAIENEEVELDERYGRAIQTHTQRLVNYYSPEDNTLTMFFPLKQADRALGATDIEHPENAPGNYTGVDASAELVTYDGSGIESPEDLGDNHSGYLGNRGADGRLLDDGVLDLVVRDILKREEMAEDS